jgi:glycosyltransferase involved in cell wall biosynthesis
MRILILAYDFPPNGSIGGQRPYSWFKYFKQFGIHPVVVTRHWETVVTPDDTIRPCGTKVTVTETDEGTLIRVPFRPNLRDRMLLKFGNRFAVVRKILSLWFSLAQYQIPWADNRRNMLHAAREYLQEHPCDAVIATGEPFILFRYAQLLAEEFRIPWIADYRDGWSTNYHMVNRGGAINLINLTIIQKVEQRFTRHSTIVTVTAPSLKKELLTIHASKRIEVVMNGFFEELFTELPIISRDLGMPFIISCSGTLHPYQKLEIFLEGLHLLIKHNDLTPNDIQLVFIGLNYDPQQLERVMEWDSLLSPYIKSTERIAHEDTIGILNSSDLLLLLANQNFGQIYAKVFDYLALGKPVLLCENDHGPLESILTESGTGIVVDTPQQVAEKLDMLLSGKLQVIPRPERLQKFSRSHQTSILANIIKDTLHK